MSDGHQARDGAGLRLARRARGLSQQQLAMMAGVSRQAISLAGMRRGGPSTPPAEPVFRHRWEAVARALLAVVAGAVEASGGEFRHSIERMEPGRYLTSSYYTGSPRRPPWPLSMGW